MANPNEMKTRKVLDMCDDGFRIVVIKDYSDSETQYRIYRKTWNSKRLLLKVSNMFQVILFIDQSYLWGMDKTTVDEHIKWVKTGPWKEC